MENQGKIFKAIVEVAKKVKAIGKDNKNLSQGFMYRSIDQMYAELHEIMSEEGIFTVPKVLSRTERQVPTKTGGIWNHICLEVVYLLYADDGSHIELGPIWGEGMDGGDKGSNKAISIAHKYAFIQLFSIPTIEDKDPDAHTPPEAAKQITPPQNKPIFKPQVKNNITAILIDGKWNAVKKRSEYSVKTFDSEGRDKIITVLIKKPFKEALSKDIILINYWTSVFQGKTYFMAEDIEDFIPVSETIGDEIPFGE